MARNVEDVIGSAYESGGNPQSGISRVCKAHSDCPPKKMCYNGKCIKYSCLPSAAGCPDNEKWDSDVCACKPKDVICKAPGDWDDDYKKADYAIASLKSMIQNCTPVVDGLAGKMITIGGVAGYGKCYGDPVLKHCTEVSVMVLSGGKWTKQDEVALFYTGSGVVDCGLCAGIYHQATTQLFWGGFDLDGWVNADPAKRIIKL
jgi:hypothetical protein